MPTDNHTNLSGGTAGRKIGIVGAGHLGGVLAKRLVSTGYAVKVANSRGRGSLSDFAQQTGAEAADIATVAVDVDILILAIPLSGVKALPKAMVDALPPGSVIVEAGNYVPPRDGIIPEIEAGLAETAWVSRQLGVPVVKAFNNVTEFSLKHDAKPKGAQGRIALPVAGDDPEQRARVMHLVEELGFDAFDAGPLADSWRQQIGQPAYCTNPTREQLQRLLGRADLKTVSRKREQSMKIFTKIPADFPQKDLVRAARFMVGLDGLHPASWLSVSRLGLAMLRGKP